MADIYWCVETQKLVAHFALNYTYPIDTVAGAIFFVTLFFFVWIPVEKGNNMNSEMTNYELAVCFPQKITAEF